MKAEQLRKSILQLAIQGKLVKQDPNDEPASVLLERIRAEKQRLIKEGKIKKDKGDSIIFKGDDNCHYEKVGSEVKNIEDEIDFDLPDGWSFARINNFCTVVFSGKSPKYSKEETKHKVIGQQANQWEGVNLQYVKYCTEEFVIDMPELYYLQNGDVLLNTLGNGTLGRSGIFYNVNEQEKILTDGHLFVFRNINITLSKYLLLYLRTKYDEIVKSANGSTNQTFLSLGRTLQWLIPVPPFNEMERIVCELDKYEPLLNEYNLIETKKSKLDTEIYDKLKKSILQYAIQGKLVEQDENDEPASVLLERIRTEKKTQLGKKYVESYIYKGDDNCYYEHLGGKDLNITEEIPFDLPNGWEWQRFNTITKLITCGYAATPEYVEEGMPFLSARNVKPYKFLPSIYKKINYDLYNKLTQKNKPQRGDILMTRVGAGIGEACIIDIDFDFAIYVSLTLIKLEKMVLPEYVLHWLNSPMGISTALKNIYGKDSSQGNLNVDNVRAFLFPLPPLAEQKRIVDKINEIFAKL